MELPSFIIPKKERWVQWLSDFQKLNKIIVKTPFPLPRIQDILQQKGKYTHFTKIDLSMMFYCFERSKKICAISTKENNYYYNQLPMGVKISDVAQCFMNDMLCRILNCCCYIDYLGIWADGDFQDHLRVVSLVLSWLHSNNMKCNPLKCKWFVKEIDFLGFWMTHKGLKPWKKHIDAILKMGRPQNNNNIWAFIGAVNHYKSLWPRHTHMLNWQAMESLCGHLVMKRVFKKWKQ